MARVAESSDSIGGESSARPNASPSGTLEALLESAQRGNAKAYDQFLRNTAKWLRRFLARRVDAALLDDVVQESLIAIHAKRHSYQAGRPVLPWIAAIARHKWIDQLRALHAQKTIELDEQIAVESHEGRIIAELSVAKLSSVLKLAQAQAIQLNKLEGYSAGEISIFTGQSEALVRVNVHRGLHKMRGLLLNCLDIPESPRRVRSRELKELAA